jgi:hypothetical protein
MRTIADAMRLMGQIGWVTAGFDENTTLNEEIMKALVQQFIRIGQAMVEDYGVPWSEISKMPWDTTRLGEVASDECRKLEQMFAAATAPVD